MKEDGTFAEAGESLDFKVTEFHKEERRIVLSHSKAVGIVDDEKEEKAPAAKKKEAAAPKKAKVEKPKADTASSSTLGDIEALSALKDKMNN